MFKNIIISWFNGINTEELMQDEFALSMFLMNIHKQVDEYSELLKADKIKAYEIIGELLYK